MNFNLQAVLDKIDTDKKNYTSSAKRKYSKILEKQLQDEKLLLEEVRVDNCSYDLRTLIRNTNDIYKFYDPDSINKVSCLVDSIVTEDKEHPDRALTLYIKDLKRIGEESVMGNAYSVSLLKDNKNLIIVKTAKEKSDYLIHEGAVGILCLNKLRSIIPNFSCVYSWILWSNKDHFQILSFSRSNDNCIISKYYHVV